MKNLLIISAILILVLSGCSNDDGVNTKSTYNSVEATHVIQDLNGRQTIPGNKVWLSHEHTLVDFIGANKISSEKWDHSEVIKVMSPYFEQLQKFDVAYFVDATPNYLGRDVALLKKLSDLTGIKVITNTGLYGARNKQYLPGYVKKLNAEELAAKWIEEFNSGIDGTGIKPGFIKIGVDVFDPLHPLDKKLVEAAAITHLKTGLTIVSHTGPAKGLWPQLEIVKNYGVSPSAFVWVHAQFEYDRDTYLKAAESGVWISFDGVAWDLESHIQKLIYARENNFLHRVLISSDAGWFDPQKPRQTVKPYTDIFTSFIPALQLNGFTEDEINLLLKVNPAKAYGIGVKRI